MKQAVLNLLLNALEATSVGGRIEVHTEQSSAQTVVEVRDTGKGIPPEMLDRIFDPYFTMKDRGTGLGLAIVHRIVEEHGGCIEAESVEGEGSVFRIVVPARPES
jgi:signal transduction histidine kinase